MAAKDANESQGSYRPQKMLSFWLAQDTPAEHGINA